jgi:hypothetical protein
MVKDYESRAGTGLLAAERAELRVTAWAMRRTRRGKEQAEEMSVISVESSYCRFFVASPSCELT